MAITNILGHYECKEWIIDITKGNRAGKYNATIENTYTTNFREEINISADDAKDLKRDHGC